MLTLAPKGFSNQAFPAVSKNGRPYFPGYGKAIAAVRKLIRTHVNDKRRIGDALSASKDALKLSRVA